ncbi:acetyl-CoA synthetase-like protein [Periconia macrospinosa]|uniref:Acetyl-CoA synthetase-like protein n=1 Tax=Periconia macrospinosa TaxID=97972 RepID=A0A2V1DAU7_9PLEO|nr:acetyl-CoA synthetase-like protein [Periconia macrospinosa]
MVQKLSYNPSINVGDRRLHPKAQVENALSLGRGPLIHSKWPSTLIERFSQVCDLQPDTVAIQDDGCCLTYLELSDRVHALAAAISTAGILTGDYVALVLDLFAAMLGMLHVGAVFVPLDITVPTARNMAMNAVYQPKLVMYDTSNAEMFEQLFSSQYQLHSLNLSDVSLKHAGEISRKFQYYAFLLFTSGSTGTPKGVKITQSGVMKN